MLFYPLTLVVPTGVPFGERGSGYIQAQLLQSVLCGSSVKVTHDSCCSERCGWSAGRIQLEGRHHVAPVLGKLHWLPISFRTQFKVLLLTLEAIYRLGPKYVTDHLLWYVSAWTLRSMGEELLWLAP